MAKKRPPKKQKRENSDPVDNIPQFATQPRSPAPKRRTDFSLFFPSPIPSFSNSGSFRPGSSGTTMTSLEDDEGKELHGSLVQCSKLTDKRSRLLSDFYEVPVSGVGTASQDERIDRSSDSASKNDIVPVLEPTPEKLQATQSNGVCIAQGKVVWARKACQMWWPAEIIGEAPSLADSRMKGIDGHVLVQFYGKQSRAWIDPARDLSEFEDCFDERSQNFDEDFQDALKQALGKKEDANSSGQLLGSFGTSNHSDEDNLSPIMYNQMSFISSSKKGDILKKGRARREQKQKQKQKRKCKIPFGEVAFPLKPATKVRRFKIMRLLGLTPPIGSPF